MKFTTFKKIYTKANRVFFETKQNYLGKTYCYMADSFTVLRFEPRLKPKILDALGMNGCMYECFQKLKDGEITPGDPKNLDIHFEAYREGESNVKDTGVLLDFGNLTARVLECEKGLVCVNNDFVKMAKEILGLEPNIYKTEKSSGVFLGRGSVAIMALPVRVQEGHKAGQYFTKPFVI